MKTDKLIINSTVIKHYINRGIYPPLAKYCTNYIDKHKKIYYKTWYNWLKHLKTFKKSKNFKNFSLNNTLDINNSTKYYHPLKCPPGCINCSSCIHKECKKCWYSFNKEYILFMRDQFFYKNIIETILN